MITFIRSRSAAVISNARRKKLKQQQFYIRAALNRPTRMLMFSFFNPLANGDTRGRSQKPKHRKLFSQLISSRAAPRIKLEL